MRRLVDHLSGVLAGMLYGALRCAWRASHDTTTSDGITRCRRCGREWTR